MPDHALLAAAASLWQRYPATTLLLAGHAASYLLLTAEGSDLRAVAAAELDLTLLALAAAGQRVVIADRVRGEYTVVLVVEPLPKGGCGCDLSLAVRLAPKLRRPAYVEQPYSIVKEGHLLAVTYLGWYDDDSKKTATKKIDEGIERFAFKYANTPNICLTSAREAVSEHPRIRTRAVAHLRPNYYYIGFDETLGPAQAASPTVEAADAPPEAKSRQ